MIIKQYKDGILHGYEMNKYGDTLNNIDGMVEGFEVYKSYFNDWISYQGNINDKYSWVFKIYWNNTKIIQYTYKL